jgi:hypothetical protein
LESAAKVCDPARDVTGTRGLTPFHALIIGPPACEKPQVVEPSADKAQVLDPTTSLKDKVSQCRGGAN